MTASEILSLRWRCYSPGRTIETRQHNSLESQEQQPGCNPKQFVDEKVDIERFIIDLDEEDCIRQLELEYRIPGLSFCISRTGPWKKSAGNGDFGYVMCQKD